MDEKRASFDPTKLRGEKAAHFARQLDRLGEVNAAGGLGLWSNDAAGFVRVLHRLLEWPVLNITFDERGRPWMDNGEP